MSGKRLTVHGATLRCTQGTAPSALQIPAQKTSSETFRAGTPSDHVPLVNVHPFGACRSPSNPQVAAATAAAGGALTPQPCVPVIPAPWTGASTISSTVKRALIVETSTCACQWAGTIEVVDPGTKVTTT
jgi:hypothetical protein